jgi:hypothetical protein
MLSAVRSRRRIGDSVALVDHDETAAVTLRKFHPEPS